MECGGTLRWKKPDRRMRSYMAAHQQILDLAVSISHRVPLFFSLGKVLLDQDRVRQHPRRGEVSWSVQQTFQYRSRCLGPETLAVELPDREAFFSLPRHQPASRKDRKAAVANRDQRREYRFFRYHPHS